MCSATAYVRQKQKPGSAMHYNRSTMKGEVTDCTQQRSMRVQAVFGSSVQQRYGIFGTASRPGWPRTTGVWCTSDLRIRWSQLKPCRHILPNLFTAFSSCPLDAYNVAQCLRMLQSVPLCHVVHRFCKMTYTRSATTPSSQACPPVSERASSNSCPAQNTHVQNMRRYL